ncbi:MAG: hypothetical protein M3P24_10115 [Gemmatimonadota bacterium]|nr:hypothetical protein [Gemmatimonadota bacterium]
MKSSRTLNFSLVMALAAALSASPALAQGKGKGNGHGKKQKTEQVRDDRRWEDRRDDDRWDDDVRLERRDRRVPPGWCKGKGNPHNTVENCGYDAARRGDRVYRGDREDRRYEDRGRYEDRRYDRRGGSFDQEHTEFHRRLDEEYRARAAQRPLDVRWQLEVRRQKSEEHQRWHRSAGIDHDGRRY